MNSDDPAAKSMLLVTVLHGPWLPGRRQRVKQIGGKTVWSCGDGGKLAWAFSDLKEAVSSQIQSGIQT